MEKYILLSSASGIQAGKVPSRSLLEAKLLRSGFSPLFFSQEEVFLFLCGGLSPSIE